MVLLEKTILKTWVKPENTTISFAVIHIVDHFVVPQNPFEGVNFLEP